MRKTKPMPLSLGMDRTWLFQVRQPQTTVYLQHEKTEIQVKLPQEPEDISGLKVSILYPEISILRFELKPNEEVLLNIWQIQQWFLKNTHLLQHKYQNWNNAILED